MGWFRNMVMRILNIQPAQEKTITIKEPLSFEGNVLKNRIWYCGDPSELDQFFKQAAMDKVGQSRFWAAVPSENLNIRKIHSGLPSMIADRLSDIVVADMNKIELDKEETPTVWEEISKDNNFDELVGEAIAETLVTGDGAFKITIDTDITQYPILEYYSGERVAYNTKRNRVHEVLFYTNYAIKEKQYRLEEIFGKGYIKYKLYDKDGKEVPLTTVPETADLKDTTFSGDFIMAVPLMFFKSPKFHGRGKSIFDSKSDSFDALDETISQWVDAVRAGRVKNYIPEDMIPRDPNTGELMKPNPFDNQFIKLQSTLSEESKSMIDTVQPSISYEAFVSTYANNIDMCLQGIISPSTLGIDLKKTDNAEAQREKEKATLYTRGKIIDTLTEVIPKVVVTALKVYDTMNNKVAGEYEASVSFGEYGAPDFGTVVEVVSKAALQSIMSIEQQVEELWGDTKDEDWKKEEVKRIKELKGIITAKEPSVGDIDNITDSGDDIDTGATKSSGLNGAQVASLINVVRSVKAGELSNAAAIALITSSFKLTEDQAKNILDNNVL